MLNPGPLRVTVVGAGLMGHSIAQVIAHAGWPIVLQDALPAAIESAPARMRASLVDLGLDPALADRVRLETDLETAVADAELVIEAVPEIPALKRDLFARMSRLVSPETILASNTSVISIGEIGAEAVDRGRVLGTHWWNPPAIVPLVEVIQTEETRPEVVERTIELLRALGKEPVHVRRDVPGFVGNRLQHALWREAFHLIDEGVCDAATIDLVVKRSFGLRLPVIGPLESAELVGLDLSLAIQEYLAPHLYNSGEPSPGLRAHVDAGELGVKTGKGYREWGPGASDEGRTRVIRHLRAMQERATDEDDAAG